MYFAAVALVGASLGQPPALVAPSTNPHDQDILYSNSRLITLPIRYNQDRKTIKRVSLHYALNGENTWYLAAVATPDQDRFTFTAKDDGLYWFTIVDEDLQGHKNPEDLTKTPPDLKVIIDTVPPRVQFSKTDCYRKGESITVVWTVEDKNPNEDLTKVYFKSGAADSPWKEVSLPPTSKSGVRFTSSTMEPVIVRVTAGDMAKNKGEETFSFPAAVVTAPISTTVPAGGSPLGPVAPPPIAPAPTGVTALSVPTSGSGGSVVPAGTPLPPPAIAMPVSTPPPPLAQSGPAMPPFPASNPGAGIAAPAAPPPPSAPTIASPSMPSYPPASVQSPVAPVSQPTPGSTSTAQSTSSYGGAPPPLPTSSTNTVDTVVSPVVPPVVPTVISPNIPPSLGSPTSSPLPASSAVGSGAISTSTGGTAVLPPAPLGAGPSPLPLQPLAPFDPRSDLATPSAGSVTSGSQAPLPAWSGPPVSSPTIEVSRATVINFLAFDLGYDVEARGPSGISRVDLWVTRDDGLHWQKWSQHDGKGSTIHVSLNLPTNTQPEGPYGFRVVPVSGVDLSGKEPAPGDAPDLKVVVDLTPPQLDIFKPEGDPSNPDTLIIQWRAMDKNFNEDPITIEWSDKPTGPWQPVATGGDTVPTTALRRLPNKPLPGTTPAYITGQYAWRVPVGLSPRVYLKICARDAAGNVREVITRNPVPIDLVKPRAKISGIVAPPALTLSKP